jgi:AICAR transformylase/IMP cyclohydrolase PurH
MIAATLGEVKVDAGGTFTRGALQRWTPVLSKVRDLRYGETRARRRPGLPPAPWFWWGRRSQGKELSFTNLLDLDAAARIALDSPGLPRW